MKPGTVSVGPGSKQSTKVPQPISGRLDMRKSVEVQVDSDFALLLPGGVYEIKKMEPRSRLRHIILICLILAVAGIIGFGYFCPDQVRINCRITNNKYFATESFQFNNFVL